MNLHPMFSVFERFLAPWTELAPGLYPTPIVRPRIGPPSSSYRERTVVEPLLVVHVTDVEGGFGVCSWQWRPWLKRARSGDPQALELFRLAAWVEAYERWLDAEDDHPGPMYGFEPRPVDDLTEDLAKRVALWERYSRTPYHWIAGCNGDEIENHPWSLRTSHGNRGGNAGCGLAIDVGRNQILTPEMIETGRAVLLEAIGVLYQQTGERVAIVAHRCTSAMRREDPNEFVWREIVKPMVLENAGRAWIDYEYKVGRGRPIPTTWDDDALFDARGRRVRR